MNGRSHGTSDLAELPTPFPKIVEDDGSQEKEKENRVRKRASGTAPGHKRSGSGNILSRLTFLRTNGDPEKSDGTDSDRLHPSRGAMAEVQGKRKRKGSLRKTVLGKGRDRKGSDAKKSPLSTANATPVPTPEHDYTPRPSHDLSSPLSPESPPPWPFRTLSKVSIPSIRSSVASIDPPSTASITSPTMPTDPSTDDEDLAFPRMPALRKLPSTSSTTDSYFAIQEPVRRIFTTGQTRSPLAKQPPSIPVAPAEDDGWDYSETAFWGYVILIVTWIVFVVGMGSCFGVWSWAWDVGETPYAPPELEDDPTLPIVGYYPALLVLTCVMAWVWVVAAWVGMKYFRHADFRGDD